MVLIAERTVRVSLIANATGYIAEVGKATAKTRELGSEAEKLAQRRQGFEVLGRSALAVGAAAGAGVALAVSKFADFDKAMSGVRASTHESAENMDLLRAAALKAGEDTVYSASEAAGAIESLAKAGVSTADILGGGLSGALDLAASGELAVADAADIAASALTQFGLKGAQVPHVADLLSAAAGKAQGSVSDMGAALNQSGLVASQMGLSIEEATGTLAAFAKTGLIGSDAGTSFRTMLLRLANPTDEAKRLMEQYNIAAYDAQDNFVGMEALAGQLTTGMGKLGEGTRNAAMATIFGQDAIRGANVLYEQGADGIAKWIKNVDDSGYAAETAALRLDNLAGDVEALGGSLETALINSGSAANDTLRFLTQTATDAVNGFNNLDPAVQGASLGFGALVSAAGLATGAFFTAVPRVAEFNAALDNMGPKAQKAGRAAVGLGKGLGVIAGLGAAVVVLDKIASSGDQAAAGVEEVTEALRNDDLSSIFARNGNSVDTFAKGLQRLTGDDLINSAERFGSSLNGIFFGGQLADNVQETAQSFETVGESLARMVSGGDAVGAAAQFRDMAAAAELQGVSTEELLDLMPAYREALAGVRNENATAEGAAQQHAEALGELQGAAEDAGGEIDALAEQIRGFGSAQFDVNEASRAVSQAIDDFSASLAENGQTLDRGTEAGRANEAAVEDAAKAYLDLAAATVTQTGNQDDANAIIANGRDRIIKMREALGDTTEEAEAYADSLELIPGNVSTAVKITGTSAAAEQIQRVLGLLNSLPASRHTSVGVTYRSPFQAPNSANGNLFDNGRVMAFASGGFASGIYSGRAGGIHKFAEPETRWEAYVSGKPGQEARNRSILMEAGERLGMWRAAPAVQHATASGAQGRAGNYVQQLIVQNPKQETVARSVVSGLREMELELGT